MSRAGVIAAKQYGFTLPQFRDEADATRALFAERDFFLAKLQTIAKDSNGFAADYSPQSLKPLERWYFELSDANGFAKLGVDRSDFERCISFYLGEVFVRHGRGFEWFVTEFPFERGRYGIGVRRPLFSLMLTHPRSLSKVKNVRMQSLWRQFQSYAP